MLRSPSLLGQVPPALCSGTDVVPQLRGWTQQGHPLHPQAQSHGGESGVSSRYLAQSHKPQNRVPIHHTGLLVGGCLACCTACGRAVHTLLCHPSCFHPSISPVQGCLQTASSCDNHEPCCPGWNTAPDSLGTCCRLHALCWKIPGSRLPAAATRSQSALSTRLWFPLTLPSSESGNTGTATTSGEMETENVPDCVPGVLSIQPGLLCPCSMPCPQHQIWGKTLTPVASPAQASVCPQEQCQPHHLGTNHESPVK